MAKSANTPHVVIIGAGFAGLYAARRLEKRGARVTLLDQRNHHLFQPLLYQVAMAGLSAVDIAQPVRRIFRRQRKVEVLMATVVNIDAGGRKVELEDGRRLSYDSLIVATGATHSYFGNDQWARHAPGLKTLEDALEIRRKVLLAFERAEAETDPEKRRAWLTFAVIGAGPTGCELAGALAELSRHTLFKDFHHFDAREAKVLLLEGRERVLPPYPEDLSAKAQEQLETLGVEVRTNSLVTELDDQGITLKTGERIPTHTVIWAAGVAASPLGAKLAQSAAEVTGRPLQGDPPRSEGSDFVTALPVLDRAGRVRVEEDLTLPGFPEIFVVGDLMAFEQAGGEVPGVAPAAIQSGVYAANVILQRAAGKPTEPFRYRDKGSMATLGRKSAVATLGKLRLSGITAWLTWLGVHIVFLIGFRNRIVVIFEWARAYFTYQRSARLILHEPSPYSESSDTPESEPPLDP
ncbi:MAG: NAD(P)/FAD-dependent oxidoreductase [Acidobacteriota bacterium]